MDNNSQKIVCIFLGLIIINIIALGLVCKNVFGEKMTNFFEKKEVQMVSHENMQQLDELQISILNIDDIKWTDGVNNIEFESDKAIVSFVLNEPEEFDNKFVTEILTTRVGTMRYYQEKGMINLDDDYKVSEKIFGQIKNKRPWWGWKGFACKGPGVNSPAGLSKASNFINNPMLLVGIDTRRPWYVNNWDCPDLYPKVISLELIPDQKKFVVNYELSDFHEKIFSKVSWKERNPEHFIYFYQLNALNARDFGYEYGYVSDYKNIKFASSNNISDNICNFKNSLQVNGHCGATGMECNDIVSSPEEMVFAVEKYPAEITLHLFKELPKTTDAQADVVYEIKIQ